MIQWKYGLISDMQNGKARVLFPVENIVTPYWPILRKTSLVDKQSWPLNPQEQVICLCDKNCEEGVILGAVDSDVDAPDSGAAAGLFRMLFSDGTLLCYDKNLHKLTANVQGEADLIASVKAVVQAPEVDVTASTKAVITSPIINLTGNVTIAGTLSAGSLSLAPVAGNDDADGKVHGNIDVTGTVTADTDVTAGGISLISHIHSGVTTGSGVSGPAEG